MERAPQNTQIATKAPPTPRQVFGQKVQAIAERELVALAGSENGRAAAARVALAFRSAVATAKDPDAFFSCSPESVAAAMATSAFTQIMPGGPYPGCYLIPKMVNKVQTLNWWISHRGIKALARRAGQAIEAIPYFPGDDVIIVRGQHWTVDVVEGPGVGTNADGTTYQIDRDSVGDLEGFVYYVTDLETGRLLAARKVPKRVIAKRRAASDSVDKQSGEAKWGPWRDWPMEMAEKTVIKYAAGRGDVVFDDVGNMALSREAEDGDVAVSPPVPAATTAPRRLAQILDADPLAGAQGTRDRAPVTRNESADPGPTDGDM